MDRMGRERRRKLHVKKMKTLVIGKVYELEKKKKTSSLGTYMLNNILINSFLGFKILVSCSMDD